MWLISLSLALSAALLVNLPRLLGDKPRLAAALLLLLAPWGIGLALQGNAWTASKGEPLKVAAVQGNVEQNMKWDPAQLEAAVLAYNHSRAYLRLVLRWQAAFETGGAWASAPTPTLEAVAVLGPGKPPAAGVHAHGGGSGALDPVALHVEPQLPELRQPVQRIALPSTSPAHAAMGLEALREAWSVLAQRREGSAHGGTRLRAQA